MVLLRPDRADRRAAATQAPIAPTDGPSGPVGPVVPTWLVGAFVVADAAVLLTRFPFLAGLQGFTPSLPYEVFAVALAARGLVLVGVLTTSIPVARR